MLFPVVSLTNVDLIFFEQRTGGLLYSTGPLNINYVKYSKARQYQHNSVNHKQPPREINPRKDSAPAVQYSPD